jgi:hypothetical protein
VSTSQRLLARLLAEVPAAGFELGPRTRLERVRASAASRSAGAWSWQAIDPDNLVYGVGSQYTMAQCLAAPRLVVVRQGYRASDDVVVDPSPLP